MPPASVVVPVVVERFTPAVSLSKMFAPTLATAIPLYVGSTLVALCVTRRKSGLTSAIASLNAETVTVCGTLQFPAVKIRVCPAAGRVPTRSWASALTTMLTSAVGWLRSTTV